MTSTDYPSIWNLSANPVFRRHAVSRLRPLRLMAWLFVIQVIAGFSWCAGVLLYLQANEPNPGAFEFGSEACRTMLHSHGQSAFLSGWMVVLVLQALVLLVKGTFSVATGAAREASEGMTDSLRLSPLPDGHKTIGQLLGLPVLENILVLLLLPWAALSCWLGHLPAGMMAKVYLILATSGLFHHSIGLVAGTMIRQKILAGTISQMLVILLHFVLPSLRGLGLGLISHLGARSAIVHEIAKAMPLSGRSSGPLAGSDFSGSIECYAWQVSISGYHWVVTVSLLFTMLAVVMRRWSDQTSPLLGRLGTILLTGWVLFLTCGELLPQFGRGEGVSFAFTSSILKISMDSVTAMNPTFPASVWMFGFAVVLGLLSLLMTGILTPSVQPRETGSRDSKIFWKSFKTSNLPSIIIVALLNAGAWSWVTGVLVRDTPRLEEMSLGFAEVVWAILAFLLPANLFHAFLRRFGWKRTMLAGFLVWILPVMLSLIGLMMSTRPDGWPMWLAGMSGILLPGFAAVSKVAGPVMQAARPVFHVSLMINILLLVFILVLRSKYWKSNGSQ